MKQEDKSDRILIIGLKYGDEKCFEALFQKYYPRFRAFTYRLVRDNYQAEDIMQNVFMKLWINRLTIDENVSIVTYLFVLTRNEILNQLRYNRLHPPVTGTEVVKEATVGNEFDFDDLYSLVMQIVENNLPKRRREIFKMNRFEHLSAAEIASRLGISPRTVEKQIELALRTIRDTLGPILSVMFMLGQYQF